MDSNQALSVPDSSRLTGFNQHRRLLFSISYRTLGSVTDAEDILQKADIRLHVTSK